MGLICKGPFKVSVSGEGSEGTLYHTAIARISATQYDQTFQDERTTWSV